MFFGESIENLKDNISELDQNLTFEVLSGTREIQFQWVSDLVLHITYKLQNSILLNTEKKTQVLKIKWLVKEKYNLDEKPSVDDKFEEQIIMDILNNVWYDHIKTGEPYVEPTVQDAQTIDDKIKQENEDFLQIAAKFNKIDMAATAQKKSTFTMICLMRNWFTRQTIDAHIQQKIFLLMTICLVKMTLEMTIGKDILMQYAPPEKDVKTEQKEKRKNHRYFWQVKESVKNFKKLDKRKMKN